MITRFLPGLILLRSALHRTMDIACLPFFLPQIFTDAYSVSDSGLDVWNTLRQHSKNPYFGTVFY